MEPWDHTIAILMVALPLSAMRRTFPRILRELERGVPGLRGRLYVNVSIQQTALGLALLGYWWVEARPFASLGLGFDTGGPFALTALFTLSFAAAWVVGHALLAGHEGGRDWMRRYAERTLLFLPHTLGERNRFFLLSISAGVWEEIYFRGFLLAYLTYFFGVLSAVIASSLVFALAHLYQGWVNAGIVFAMGVIFSVIFVWSGSLWLAMFLHVVIDANAAFVGLRLNRATESGAAPA